MDEVRDIDFTRLLREIKATLGSLVERLEQAIYQAEKAEGKNPYDPQTARDLDDYHRRTGRGNW